MSENQTNTQAARQTGRMTFFELADQDGVQAATDLMLRVVRMTPLLDEADVAKWRKAYEEHGHNVERSVNGIIFELERGGETNFQITTPSFRGSASEINPGAVRWEVFERDTNWNLGRGEAKNEDDAIDQMTKVISENI